jgi:hypothetical protein
VVCLCQTDAVPAPAAVAALTPTCPAEGTVTGTITPAQVVEAVGQGLAAGEFGELIAAIRAGRTYANVHSATFPLGRSAARSTITGSSAEPSGPGHARLRRG